MSKIDLQAEIKAIQEFGKEAENLINKMNASAEKINEASDLEVQRIKKQIERDLDELSLYISERVDIDVSRAVEKIRMDILWNGLRLCLDTPATA